MENSELEKLGVWKKGLKQHSKVFNSEFSILGIMQNGKLRVESLRKLILRGFRELRVFDLAAV